MEQVITTKYGKIKGFEENGLLKFLGIPFAKQPKGELKWKRAKECEPWEGMIEAFRYGDVAPQYNQEKWQGSTDCLTINVVRPKEGEKLPVFVWIHGGGYSTGGNNDTMYTGEAFAKDGCVYVNFQYRLSVLGFYEFCGYPGCEGFETNRGLSDMILGLKWIHENIAAFGGDPGNVTIVGESAGGSAVVTLMAVPSVKGYFQKVIAESGLCELVDTVEAQKRKVDLMLEGLFLSPEDPELGKKLRELDDYRLIEGHLYQEKHAQYVNPGILGAGPVIDDLLPERPIDALRRGVSGGVALLIGTNLHEGTMFVRPEETTFPNDWAMVREMLEKNGYGERYPEFKAHYEALCKDGFYGTPFVKIATDLAWEIPSTFAALAHSQYGATYMYRFEYMTDFARDSGMLVTHAFELPCVFAVKDHEFSRVFFEGETEEAADKIIRELHEPWVRFVKTGDPGGDWTPFSAEKQDVMVFDHASHIADLHREESLALWEDLKLYR